MGFKATWYYLVLQHRGAAASRLPLKVPKCEIFDRSDFHDFYTIKPFWVADFGAKILTCYLNFWGS